MKTPTVDESKRCLQIRKRSKRGEYSSPEDHDFCGEMFKKYRDWYYKTEDEVFNNTVPVGSNIRRVDGETVYLK
jgi:hypothetical protein